MIQTCEMDEALLSRSCEWMTSGGAAADVGDAGKRAKDLWRSLVFRVSPQLCSSSAVGGDEIRILPPPPSFHVAAAVGQAPSDSVSSSAFMSDLAAACVQEGEQSWQAQQQIWKRQPKEEEVQQDHNLHRRKQMLHPQQQRTDQRQQEVHDAHREPQMEVLPAQVQAEEELKRSSSGIGRLHSVTRLSSGEFRMWRTFLLPTAATALSVPMLIVVGSAPVLCMLLFITCLHNVLIAMFMMHWVCMVAVPLLYVKFVERSFDYYLHVWTVQSCRFAAQWKPDLLLACFSAIFFYVTYRVLRRWGGPWFAAVLDVARANALVAGLELPFVSLLAVGCYFCLCNPIIEEWFWRVFLYREFGGAVFFTTENRTGIFVLREMPRFPVLWNRAISSQDTTAVLSAVSSPDLGDSSGRGADAFLKAASSDSFSAADEAYNYRELSFDKGGAAATEKEERSFHAAGSPAADVVSSSSNRTAALLGSFPAASSCITADDTTSRSFSSTGAAAKYAPGAAYAFALNIARETDAFSFEARHQPFKFEQTPSTPLLPSRSFTFQPTARTDALLVEAADEADTEEDDVNVAPSLGDSPLAKRGTLQSVAAVPDGANLVPGFRDGAVEFLPAEDKYFERRPATTMAASSSAGEESMSVHRSHVPSPPAPDAPILTRVGRGLLQVDLRLSLLGQIVLSLFYASYHTVVFGSLTGTVGGCVALPCVAVLGMIFIFLRNSCTFGLLGGVLVHVGVDLGVVLVLGAVLQFYP